jgi:hypothetical protein
VNRSGEVGRCLKLKIYRRRSYTAEAIAMMRGEMMERNQQIKWGRLGVKAPLEIGIIAATI